MFCFDISIQKSLQSKQRSFLLNTTFQTLADRVVVYGSSGAGKSQMLQAIAGLSKPDNGHIRLNGQTLFDKNARVDLSPQRRRLGYLFQDYALFPHLTVRQNVAFGLSKGWYSRSSRHTCKIVDDWLCAFEMTALAEQYPDNLSGGQRQRVALARALAPEPQALLLDEPFAALDPGLRTRMRSELDDWLRKLELPLLLITHDQEDVDCFGSQVFEMNNGMLCEV